MSRRYTLKSVNWELTRQNDEDSLHEAPCTDISPEEELTTGECLKVIDEMGQTGVEVVCIQGGPIFFRKDWETLAQALVDKGIKLALISGGSGIKAHIPKLKQYFKGVAITLEGPQSIHDMIRQKSGAFENAVDSIVCLNEAGIHTGVITTVSNHNIEALDSLGAIISEVCPGDWLIRTTLSSGAMKRPGYESFTVPPADVVILIKTISDFRKKHNLKVNAGCDIGYYTEEENIRPAPWAGCTGGIWSLGITAAGGITTCLALPDELGEGNVREVPLPALWGDPGAFACNRAFNPESMSGYCRVCEHSFTCGCGCIASAIASTNSRFDNFYCFERVTKEFKFWRDHPDGGHTAMQPALRSRLAQDELFKIMQELTENRKKLSDN